MILRVHLAGAADYAIGNEIWEQSLAEAIATEPEAIAGAAGSDLLASSDQAHHEALRDRVIGEMTAASASISFANGGVGYLRHGRTLRNEGSLTVSSGLLVASGTSESIVNSAGATMALNAEGTTSGCGTSVLFVTSGSASLTNRSVDSSISDAACS